MPAPSAGMTAKSMIDLTNQQGVGHVSEQMSAMFPGLNIAPAMTTDG
jgi:hypothetical protein